MNTALRQRVQVLLSEDESSRSSGLREQVRRVLAEGKDEEEDGEKKESGKKGALTGVPRHLIGKPPERIPAPEGEFDAHGNVVDERTD